MRTPTKVVLVAVAQAVVVVAAVAPQVLARTTGESYLLRVAPVDPVDPFRGAYVDLDYPDLEPRLRRADGGPGPLPGGAGAVYVALRPEGEVWVADGFTRERPTAAPYLACDDRTASLRCGIESWFLPQDEARELERTVSDGAWAEVRIDERGRAALVDVRPAP